MKQNLRYSLLMLLLAVFNLGVFAADETIDFSKQGYSNGDEISSVSLPNCTITFNKGTNNNIPKYYTTGTAIRVYGGGYMTVSSTKTIEKIELTFGSGDGSNAITTDVGTYKDGTWEGSAKSVIFTVSGTTGHRRIMAVAVTYKAESQSGVAAPTLPESQNFVGSMQVEITNIEDGATVYYTTNGDDPDANSTQYTTPFTITATTTVKAIAIKGNDASDVVTRTYTKTKVDIATITGISPTTVNEGDAGTFTLAATFAEGTLAGEDYEVAWETTDNYDVLFVDDETGEFIAGEAGTVNVTVTVNAADDDTYNDVTATFAVTVKAPMTFETVDLPYEESFAGSFGKFQADGVQVANTIVWTNSSYSGTQFAKATAYISRTPYESQSYLYSPIINLTNESAATLTFEHAISNITFGTDAKLVVRQKDGDLWGDWQELTITGQPTNYTFVEGTVDLSAYAGQQIQLAFVYTSTASSAGTWEIMNLKVSNPSKVDIATINGISPTTVNVEGEGTFELDATFADGTEAGRDYEVSWTSDDEDVLMVDESTGEYLALAAGTANVTVSVTVLDDSKYYEVSETFTVTVKEPFVAATYELVTDASTLADGDKIIIAYVDVDADTYLAMGAQDTNNRLATGDVTYNTDCTLTIGEGVQQITLEGDAEGYYFNVGDGYLYASSSTKNHMKTEEEPDDNAKATIEIDENGDATIVFKGSNTRNHLRFNENNGNPIFSCYAESSSVKTIPQIYRLKSDVETVTITIGEYGYASYCGDKNLDFSATELKAYAVTQVENGVMILTEFEDGYKAGEGAVLKGDEGEYQVPVATTATAVAGNMLIGNNSDAAITVEADGITYRFGYSPAAQKVGFMKATSNFTVAPGKAYLKINSTNNAPAFLSFDGTATGIDAANVSTTAADGQRYNLNGQRVNSNYRGVVIVDGKKLIQK